MAESMEKKRIFIRGLFDGVTEDEIKQKFGKFGQINSVEIKVNKRDEHSTFAFVEMTAIPKNFSKCFSTFSKTHWKGSELKLEMAKESFLDRLKREREARNTDDRVSQHVESSPSLEPESSTKGNLDMDSNYSHGVPKFTGIKSLKKKTIQDDDHSIREKSKYFEPSVSKNGNEESMPSSDGNSDFMTKLEKFSGGVWGDDRPDSSFEIVKEGWNSNRCADESMTAVKSKKRKDSAKIRSSNGVESSNKQLLSNEKRLQSLHLKQSAVETQQNIVKEALSKVSKPNKKIFSTSDDDEDDSKLNDGFKSGREVQEHEDRKDSAAMIQWKPKFNESKQLESMGRRINENGESNNGPQSSRIGETKKKHWTEFVSERYDPTSKDHTKYELKRQLYEIEGQPTKKTRKEKKKGAVEEEEGSKVSGERFFEVTGSLRNKLIEKSDKPFSLTELFDSKEERNTFSESYGRNSVRSDDFGGQSMNGPRTDWFNNRGLSRDEASSHKMIQKPLHMASEVVTSDCNPVATGTFFLFNGDARLKDGVESFRKREDFETIEKKWEMKKDELRSFLRMRRKKRLADRKTTKTKPKMKNAEGKKRMSQFKTIKQKKYWAKLNARTN